MMNSRKFYDENLREEKKNTCEVHEWDQECSRSMMDSINTLMTKTLIMFQKDNRCQDHIKACMSLVEHCENHYSERLLKVLILNKG